MQMHVKHKLLILLLLPIILDAAKRPLPHKTKSVSFSKTLADSECSKLDDGPLAGPCNV